MESKHSVEVAGVEVNVKNDPRALRDADACVVTLENIFHELQRIGRLPLLHYSTIYEHQISARQRLHHLETCVVPKYISPGHLHEWLVSLTNFFDGCVERSPELCWQFWVPDREPRGL